MLAYHGPHRYGLATRSVYYIMCMHKKMCMHCNHVLLLYHVLLIYHVLVLCIIIL